MMMTKTLTCRTKKNGHSSVLIVQQRGKADVSNKINSSGIINNNNHHQTKELVNTRLADFEKRLDDVGGNFEKRLDDFHINLGKRLDDGLSRIGSLEVFGRFLMGGLAFVLGLSIMQFAGLNEKIEKQSEKIDKQSAYLNEKIDKQSAYLNEKIDKQSEKIDKQSEKVDKLIHDLHLLTVKIDQLHSYLPGPK
ncbi:hypothetical protein IV203_038657 [Nitzschia inconspicua]|uniref:Uncharacterized protein n=1 Tax=Nitzschia inconspicua TaxID=303405 RepID=A0A9K3LNB4_9STRA|nr:hypothetical protein IV203_038657 [Nitzschia inconspicua]